MIHRINYQVMKSYPSKSYPSQRDDQISPAASCKNEIRETAGGRVNSFADLSPRFFQFILLVVGMLDGQTPDIEKVANGRNNIVLDALHQQVRAKKKSP